MKVSEVEKKPTGTYVSVGFSDDTVDRLRELQEELDIPNPLDPEEFHTTIAYSRKPIEWDEIDCEGVEAKPLRLEKWKTHSEDKHCLVLLLDCPHLQDRFDKAMDLGATFDFPEYKPHITLSYDVGDDFDTDSADSSILDFAIQLAHEYSEPLELD